MERDAASSTDIRDGHAFRIDGDAITLVFAQQGSVVPALIHAGAALPAAEDLGALARAVQPPRHASQPEIAPLASLWPQSGRGYMGQPALIARRGDKALPMDLVPDAGSTVGPRGCHLVFTDPVAGISIAIDWQISSGDVIRARSTITNHGTTPLAVDRIASLCLPLPAWATHATRFHGRWAAEMQEGTAAIPHGRSGGASRGGRPGFDGGNWLILHDAGFSADQGQGLALHLAWSGDHDSLIERDADGAIVQIGPRLDPGEIVLAPGGRFVTPDAVLALGLAGRNAVRRAFHAHLRRAVLPDRANWPARRVHLNSWEAVAFGMDEDRLVQLARAGQAIGIERFVVDDGWFAGRRNDRTSLGDWVPDVQRFPAGLDRLIATVAGLGMDFGLWVEPEMISPDSALYRAQPDWCLHRPGLDRPTQRHQLVLDLARPEVSAHLFGVLDRLLMAHAIAYLKWDHNRELFPNDGVGHAQAQAHHALIDRLRLAHPNVEIESCASGGGRIDHAMLSRCHRVWPSDNNDAIDRLRINRAWSLFLPPEVLGNHVGPCPNPITGRALPMAFRAKVAMFGHMGVEADPGAMAEAERHTLAAHIACYKQYRGLLHSGVQRELAFDDAGLFGTMVADDTNALALVARTDLSGDYNARAVRFPGLVPDAFYEIGFPLADSAAGLALSGRMLADAGLVLPLSRPATAHLIAFTRQDHR